MKMSTDNDLLPFKNRSLTDIEGELWQDIPGLEDYAMVSNYGRVKKLAYEAYNSRGRLVCYKERIQAQKITTYHNQFMNDDRGNLNARVQIEGVNHSLSIGRIVYCCFVEPFDLSDSSVYVSYKDYNALNTVPDNLFKTDHSGLQQHIMKAGRKDLHFGHSAENEILFTELGRKVNKKKVSQYDMEGNYIATYESLAAAASALGLSLQSISKTASSRLTHTSGGYIWRLGAGRNKLSVKTTVKIKEAKFGTPVTRYDLDGNKVKTYDNLTSAAKEVGVKYKTLHAAVSGTLLVLEGSVWRNGTKEQINASREKKSAELRKGYIVSQYDLTGKKVATFRSTAEAAAYAEVPNERISAMAIRDDLTLNDHIWRYGEALTLPRREIALIKKNLKAGTLPGIAQYDIKGKRLRYYKTVTEASNATVVSKGAIRSSANGHKVTGGGYIWRRGKGERMIVIPPTPRPIGNKLIKEIFQYNKTGKLIARYPNMREAARKTGMHFTTIAAAVRGELSTAGGFVWKR